MVINLLYYYIILNYIPKTIYTYQTVDYQRPSNTKPYLNTKKNANTRTRPISEIHKIF